MNPSSPRFEVVNRADANQYFPNFREIWLFRFLLVNLVLREFRIRYKQTLLGVVWAVFMPIITVVIFTFVFNGLADVPSEDIPYPIFAYAGLVPWMLFANGLTFSATSIVTNSELVTKTYFPRVLAPLAKQFSGMIDALISFAILLVLMLVTGYFPLWQIIFIPLLLLMALATSLGLGLWLSALHVRFRDVGLVVPYFVQMLLYLTPVAYPSSLLEGHARILYGLNPMVTVCDGFRWALFGLDILDPLTAAVSVVTTGVILLSGLVFFQRMEGGFPDYL